jgi:hypothetical protein
MKSTLTGTSTLVMALALLVASFAPAAQAANCSTQTVAGDWSFTLTGTLILPMPTGNVLVGAVATATFDENGSITKSTEARNVGGGYADETITGSWAVKSDCTGTLYVNAYESGQLVRTSVVSMTFDDDSAEGRGVQQSLQLPDGNYVPVVLTLECRKQHSDH